MVSNDEARRASNSSLNENNQGETYGATGKSAFLFLMGSDIVIDRLGFFLKKKKNKKTEQIELERLLRTRGEMSKVGGRI